MAIYCILLAIGRFPPMGLTTGNDGEEQEQQQPQVSKEVLDLISDGFQLLQLIAMIFSKLPNPKHDLN